MGLNFFFSTTQLNAASDLGVVAPSLKVTDLSSSSDKSKEKLRQLFAVLGIREHISSSLKSYIESLSSELGLGLKRERELYRKMNQEIIRDEIMSSFQAQYTDAELDELIRFFGSPTGSKYLQSYPRLQEAAMKIVKSHLDRAVTSLNP